MIKAVHALIYSDDPEATRAFLRDVLEWPFVDDAGSEPGWLIFKTGPSEMGVHPTSDTYEGKTYSYPAATRAEIERKGAEFSGDVEDMGFGIGATLKLPGAGDILLYQPKHAEAHSL